MDLADPECGRVSRHCTDILVGPLNKCIGPLHLWTGCIQHRPVLRPVVLQMRTLQLSQDLTQTLQGHEANSQTYLPQLNQKNSQT